MGLGFFILLLISYNPVHAGIEWATGTVSSNFMILTQGGTFYYPLTSPLVDIWTNSHGSVPNEDTLTEFDAPPHDYPGTATLEAKSAGGSLPHGSQVHVYAAPPFQDRQGQRIILTKMKTA